MMTRFIQVIALFALVASMSSYAERMSYPPSEDCSDEICVTDDSVVLTQLDIDTLKLFLAMHGHPDTESIGMKVSLTRAGEFFKLIGSVQGRYGITITVVKNGKHWNIEKVSRHIV